MLIEEKAEQRATIKLVIGQEFVLRKSSLLSLPLTEILPLLSLLYDCAKLETMTALIIACVARRSSQSRREKRTAKPRKRVGERSEPRGRSPTHFRGFAVRFSLLD